MTQTYGPVQLSATSQMPGGSTHGYLQVFFSVSNSEPRQRHVIDVAVTPPYGGASCRRRVVLEPNATVEFEIFVPPGRFWGTLIVRVAIDGHKQKESIPLNVVSTGIQYGRANPSLLLSQRLNRDNFTTLWEKALASAPKRSVAGIPSMIVAGMGKGRTGSDDCNLAELDITAWSRNWLAYGKYDAIILDRTDLDRMPGGVRSALRDWALCGGCLVFAGLDSVPPSWRGPGRRTVRSGTPAGRPLGFGECRTLPTSDFTKLDKTYVDSLLRRIRLPAGAWYGVRVALGTPGTPGPNRIFPVVPDTTTPYGAIFLCLIVFGIVVGPVNLWYVAHRKKRIWLLWTLPAISVGTAFGILVFAFLAEGISPTTRIGARTILDQAAHRAATLGIVGYYCPLPPGDGLHLDPRTEVNPYPAQKASGEGASGPIDWTHEQHLGPGWIHARLSRHFWLRKCEPRNERIAFTRAPNGTLTALNGLGADVRALWFADDRDRVYFAKEIAAGARAVMTLKPDRRPADKGPADWRGVLQALDKWAPGRSAVPTLPDRLRANTYIARVEGSCPFLETGMRRPGHLTARAEVAGVNVEIDKPRQSVPGPTRPE